MEFASLIFAPAIYNFVMCFFGGCVPLYWPYL